MSIENTRSDVITYFLTEWTDTDVAIDNIKYHPTGAPYVYIRVVPNISGQPCLGRDPGETWERAEGDVIISVYVPVNGDEDGLALAEKARRTISQQRLNETILQVGYTVPAGITEDKKYYLHNVRIEYRTDNLRQEA
jgi:hypothetical protein